MCLQFDLLFWPVCLQICGPKSGEILKFTPLNRVNFRETAFSNLAKNNKSAVRAKLEEKRKNIKNLTIVLSLLFGTEEYPAFYCNFSDKAFFTWTLSLSTIQMALF